MLDDRKNAYQESLLREFSELETTLSEKEHSILKETVDPNVEYSAQHLNILLGLWTYCKIQIVMFEEEHGEEGRGGDASHQPPSEAVLLKHTPDISTVEGGFKIADYGQYLITSTGQHYGQYFFSTSPLLRTVEVMLARIHRRGALSINVLGSIHAQRFAWQKCRQYNLHLSNFEPSEIDEQRAEWIVPGFRGRA